MILQMY